VRSLHPKSIRHFLAGVFYVTIHFILAFGVVYMVCGTERWSQINQSGMLLTLGVGALGWELLVQTVPESAKCQPKTLRFATWMIGLLILVVSVAVTLLVYPHWLMPPPSQPAMSSLVSTPLTGL